MNTKTFKDLCFFRWLCEDAQEHCADELIALWKSEEYEFLVEVWELPEYIVPKGCKND